MLCSCIFIIFFMFVLSSCLKKFLVLVLVKLIVVMRVLDINFLFGCYSVGWWWGFSECYFVGVFFICIVEVLGW